MPHNIIICVQLWFSVGSHDIGTYQAWIGTVVGFRTTCTSGAAASGDRAAEAVARAHHVSLLPVGLAQTDPRLHQPRVQFDLYVVLWGWNKVRAMKVKRRCEDEGRWCDREEGRCVRRVCVGRGTQRRRMEERRRRGDSIWTRRDLTDLDKKASASLL